MKSINDFPADLRSKIRYVFTDIDGTLSTEGRIYPDSFEALWALHRRGIRVVPVSGGGAGTAIHAVRSWPIDGIITESGALAYFWKGEELNQIFHPQAPSEGQTAETREFILNDVLKRYPELRLADDQFARICDWAVDHNEVRRGTSLSRAEECAQYCRNRGYTAHVSSIHINVHRGVYDKLSMARLFTETAWGLNLDEIREQAIYVGDAANDAVMFRYFPFSCGTQDVITHELALEQLPAFVAEAPGAQGFAEIIRMVFGF